MLKNYFNIAFRNFLRNKIFSVINILGLSIGISASLVIYLLVAYDFSFDKFEKGSDRIYRVVEKFDFGGQVFHQPSISTPLAKVIRNDFTGLSIVAPFRLWEEDVKVAIPGKNNVEPIVFKKQNHMVFTDENYFSIIQYDWLSGSAKTSLQQPYQIVLTESTARLYFPKLSYAEIPGSKIYLNDTITVTVSGIVKDITRNTDFIFKTFISRATLETARLKPIDWDQWNATVDASQLFIRLSPGTTVAKIQNQFKGVLKKYGESKPGDNRPLPYLLQPLNDLHFNTDYGNFGQRIAHKPTLYGLLTIAAFLLILACINFVNLTTAQASQRAKEIGIRKTMGSSKIQLVFQFLNETFLLTLLATLLSLMLVPLLLKIFADFIPDGLHYDLIHRPDMIVFMSILLVGVSLLSGFYPAIVLSGYKPIQVLKNEVHSNLRMTRSAWFRKTLTVGQFVIAQIFIIATILVSKQVKYSLNTDLGFKKNAIIFFDLNSSDTVPNRRFLLMNNLRAIPEISAISLSNDIPSSNDTYMLTGHYLEGNDEIKTPLQVKFADTNYIRLYHMNLLAGNNLPYSDTMNNLVINETYAHILGFTNAEQAVGKYIELQNKSYPVAGVVQDFHQKSLHETIKPLLITSDASHEFTMNIALQKQNIEGDTWKTAIAKIQKKFKEVYPENDFNYNFLDDSIAKYYEAEQNISRLLMWASGLAIFISCLGLLGLVIYITNQKTKEIGIRKVLGSTVTQIVSLLSKDFLKLIIIAFIIAIPIAWYGANKWLENFAYKTTLSWWIFLAGGMIMLLIALIILGIRTFRAANANPVKSLRTE